VIYHFILRVKRKLSYKKFRRKQAILDLNNLSSLIKIHPSLLQQTLVEPSKILLIDYPLDFD